VAAVPAVVRVVVEVLAHAVAADIARQAVVPAGAAMVFIALQVSAIAAAVIKPRLLADSIFA
jgi:hypothetical protein